MSETRTVQDPDVPWGVDPADRWVMLRAETCRTLLWHRHGTADTAEALPPIPQGLADRMEAFSRRYDALDDANSGFPEPFYWEQRSDFPVAAFNEEGRVIARSLKAALPADWTVVYEDVDAWLRSKGEPLESRQLILAGTPPTGQDDGRDA